MENVVSLPTKPVTKPSKLFYKYQNLLKQSILTETDIISLKSRLGWNPKSLTKSEVGDLLDITIYGNCKEYDITDEHSQKGIDYLTRKCLKANGSNRETKQVRNLSREFFDAIKDFSHFKFVGFESVDYNIYSRRDQYMPVWRLYTKSGEYFDYQMDINLDFIEL